MLAYFLKNQCSHCAILCVLPLFFYKDTFFTWRRAAFALFLCHFCRLSATEYTDMDHGTGAYGSHGRFIR